jgi:ParB/RepB/Spo0J family partition protein
MTCALELAQMTKSVTIPLEKIIEPHAPSRLTMDEEKLRELCESFEARGQLQAIGVFPVGELFEISYGHRRYKAATILGWKELEAIVYPSDAKARYADMMDENLCREEITAAEEAYKYAEIIEELDCTEDELCKITHRPAAYIYARLDLLKKDKGVLEAVANRQIVLSVAQQLNRVDHPGHCAYLLRMAIENGASARVVAGWVVDYKRNGPGQAIDLEPFKEAAHAAIAPGHGPECKFCGSSGYPANIIWIAVHDFELDAIMKQIGAAADVPAEEAVLNAKT